MKKRLLDFLISVNSKLSVEENQSIRECFEHGEEGIGLEDLCVCLCESDSKLSRTQIDTLASFCKTFGISDEYWRMV
jgi:hypothetical protein